MDRALFDCTRLSNRRRRCCCAARTPTCRPCSSQSDTPCSFSFASCSLAFLLHGVQTGRSFPAPGLGGSSDALFSSFPTQQC